LFLNITWYVHVFIAWSVLILVTFAFEFAFVRISTSKFAFD